MKREKVTSATAPQRPKKKKLAPVPIKDATRDRRTFRPVDEGYGFIPPHQTSDVLAEELGEAFLRHATSGQDDELETLNRVVPEEMGGPFIQTAADPEFANGTDASNPEGATREPLPKVNGS